ncbi:Uncharacterised protein [Klebsiella variicola]|uniref:TIGR04255 family protein n=1 Tax=Klebsiella variicola TaxID=244366 RepID=UPI000E2B637C|nr:TIGR04255 family protein [Klebsiella variicola]SXE48775.1 Uncharacterised protein [Klebsiella variicola]
MVKLIPERLKENALVNVLFEIRFSSENNTFSNIMPGILFTELSLKNSFRTPHFEMPEIIRQQNADFKYLPLVGFIWGDYNILLGDNVLLLSVNSRYPGWETFKKHICTLMNIVKKHGLISVVERFSLKYVDIIEYPSAENIGEQLNMCISLGDENYLDPYLHLRSEKHEGDVVIIIQLAGNARAEGPAIKTREGFMIDIDCIINKRNLTFGNVIQNFESELDSLHHKNKTVFFNFLTDKALANLGAVYE